MSAHLTHEELTDKLSGVSSLTVNAHLLSCPQCVHELGRLETSIASLRDAAHSWSEKAVATLENRVPQTLPTRPRPAVAWVLAAAMILFVAGSAAYLRREPIARQLHSVQIPESATSSRPSQSQLDQDNQLLSQVSGELGESVPAPMQPLLVSESAASNTARAK